MGTEHTHQGSTQMTSYGDHPPAGCRPGPGPGAARAAPRRARTRAAAPRARPRSSGPRHRPAQRGLMSAHRPGIIPLRPLSLGDILDGAVKAVRHNPKAMIGLALLVNAVFLHPLGPAVGPHRHPARRQRRRRLPAASLTTPAATLSVAVFGQLATLILTGLLVHAVGEAVLGRRPSIGEVWRAARGRLLTVVGVNLLVGRGTLVVAALLLTPGAVLLAQQHVASGAVLLVLAALVRARRRRWVTVRTCLAGPAVVLERQSVTGGPAPSFALTRRRVLAHVRHPAAGGVIAWFVSTMIKVPFAIAGLVATGATGADGDVTTGLSVLTVVDHVGTLLASAITTPFVAAVTCLLYLDRRMRVEALDVVLVRTAASDAATRT